MQSVHLYLDLCDKLLHYQQKYPEAVLKYDSVLSAFSGHSLSDEIYMRKASIYLNNGNIQDALDSYEKIEEGLTYKALRDLTGAPYDRKKNVPEKTEEIWKYIIENDQKYHYILTAGSQDGSDKTYSKEGIV